LKFDQSEQSLLKLEINFPYSDWWNFNSILILISSLMRQTLNTVCFFWIGSRNTSNIICSVLLISLNEMKEMKLIIGFRLDKRISGQWKLESRDSTRVERVFVLWFKNVNVWWCCNFVNSVEIAFWKKSNVYCLDIIFKNFFISNLLRFCQFILFLSECWIRTKRSVFFV